MSGYVFVMGHCVACKTLVRFNPSSVPSLRINGEREPLCRSCAERWKVIHNQPGWQIPPDAYDPAPA